MLLRKKKKMIPVTILMKTNQAMNFCKRLSQSDVILEIKDTVVVGSCTSIFFHRVYAFSLSCKDCSN